MAELELKPDGTAVDAIRMDVQATLKNPEEGYKPLEMVNGLPCWPAHPRFDELVQGERLRVSGQNLESFWSTWKNPATKTLRAGEDFDQIVLGISVGALPYLFPDHGKLPEAFRKMLEEVKTVRTQAMQLWVKPDLQELGAVGNVVLDGYVGILNTWAVMNQLLPRETWPEGLVKGIHYFCAPMRGGIPPQEETDAPDRALRELTAHADLSIARDLPFLWPGREDSERKGAPFVSRYLRVNMDPSERYVQSVAGSTKYRLKADESGLSNVTLAGDWTNNGFNAGCVEAAVMSGIQAANAIQGKPLNEGITGPLAPGLDLAAAAKA